MRFNKAAWLTAAIAAAFACGCGGNQAATDMNASPTQMGTTARNTTKTGKHVIVGVVFDTNGKGDKSFNDGAIVGTELAKKDFDVEVRSAESHTAKDYETNLQTLAEGGCDLIVAVGAGEAKALETVSAKFPAIKFAILDAPSTGANVRSLTFSDQEGSFLAGYLAGLMTKSNKIGFVGSQPSDGIKKYQMGFTAGAKTANPGIEMLAPKYLEGSEDPEKGKIAATALFTDGADIVYQDAGRAGLGVLGAAKDAGKFAIGINGDQDDIAKGAVLTSVIKRVDSAIYDTIRDTAREKFTPGPKEYTLKTNGISLSEMRNTKGVIGKDKLGKLNGIAEAIKKGKLKVPVKEDQYTAYISSLSASSKAKK